MNEITDHFNNLFLMPQASLLPWSGNPLVVFCWLIA